MFLLSLLFVSCAAEKLCGFVLSSFSSASLPNSATLSNLCDFLGGYSEAVLYLEVYAKNFDLHQSVLSILPEGIAGNSEAPPSATAVRKAKKSKKKVTRV